MIDIKVKRETNPQRCEICHQSDYFIGVSNYCYRCDGIIQTSSSKKFEHISFGIIKNYVPIITSSFQIFPFNRIATVLISFSAIFLVSIYYLDSLSKPVINSISEGGEDFTIWGCCGCYSDPLNDIWTVTLFFGIGPSLLLLLFMVLLKSDKSYKLFSTE